MPALLWNPPPSEPEKPAARITALALSRRDPDRVTIKVSGKLVANLSANLVAELRLAVDQPWSGALAEQVAAAVEYDRAMREAMRRLGRRPLSTQQLRQHLTQRGHGEQAVQRAVGRLTELGLLDDAAFGRELIRQITARKAAGPRLLQTKLLQQGLDRSTVEDLLAETAAGAPEEAPLAQAAELARKKLHSLARLDPAARTRRLWGLLARRGYDPDTIQTVLRHVLGCNPDMPGGEDP
jgi:regulatory protein